MVPRRTTQSADLIQPETKKDSVPAHESVNGPRDLAIFT